MMQHARHSFTIPVSAAALLICSGLLFCTPAVAAVPSGDTEVDITQLSLEELMEARIAKVVSASKYEQRVTEAPASVTTITADEIRKYGHRNLGEILRTIPGLYVTSDRNYNYLGVRGFNRPGDYNSRLLLLIDGHRLNDNIYDTAAIGTDFPLDIELIDRIEFVRGPSSSLYGSNAFLGIINVVTRKTEEIGRELSVSGGSLNTWKGRISNGQIFKYGAELLLSGSYVTSRGHSSLYYPEYVGDSNGPDFRNNDFDEAKSIYTRFKQGNFTLSGLYQTRDKGIPTGAYDAVFNSKPNYSSDDRGYADLAYSGSISDTIDLSARLYYDAYVYNGKYNYYDRVSGTLPYVVNKDSAIGRWWGTEAVVSLTRFDNHRISLGGDFKGSLSGSQRNFDIQPYFSYLDDRHRINSWGLFLQDEYRLTGTLLLNAGLRYDNYDQFDAWNPRAALIYQPSATTTFKLVYGEAFRAPNLYERYYGDGGNTTMPNPGLKPEKIRTYEAIWEQYFGEAYNTSLSGYYSRIESLISQTTDPLSGLYVFQNYEKVDAGGIELALQAKWENGLQGRLSYAWQESKIVATGQRLHNSPQHLAKAGLSIPAYLSGLFVSPEIQYMSSRRTLQGNRTREVFLANLTLYGRELIKGLDASCSIYNLFDYRYADPGAAEHTQDSIGQDGISFRASLIYRF